MNDQQVQTTENELFLASELNVNEFVDSKRFIDTYQTLILFQSGKIKEVFKGPQIIILDDYLKRGKDNHNDDIQLYLINEEKILFETKKSSFSFGSHDFLYRVYFTNRCDYSLKMRIMDYQKFTNVFSPQKKKLSHSSILKLLTPRIEYSIKKCFLLAMRNKNSSFFDAPRYLIEISKIIDEDMSKRMDDYGLKLDVSIDSLDYVETDELKALKALILKSKEMNILNYTYQQENMIEFIKIVEEIESGE